MNASIVSGFISELDKIASFFHSPKADLAGLGLLGVPVVDKLTDKKSTKKEKAMAGIEGAGLGTLALHTMSGMGKKAAMGQAGIMKSIAQHGLRPEMAARHGLVAAKAAPAATQKVRPASAAVHSSYSDFTPAGRFTAAGSGMKKAAMRQKSKLMANYIMTHDKGM